MSSVCFMFYFSAFSLTYVNGWVLEVFFMQLIWVSCVWCLNNNISSVVTWLSFGVLDRL